MDISRVLIAFILSLVLVVAYQELVLKRLYPPPSQQGTHQGNAAKGVMPTPGAIEGNLPSSVPSGVPGLPAPMEAETANSTAALKGTSPPGPERLIEVSTDLYVARFTTRGARLKSFTLKTYKETTEPDSGLYEMVRLAPGGQLPFGGVVGQGNEVLSDVGLDYSTSAPAKIDLVASGVATVTFTSRTADGLKLEKTFVLRGGSYVFDIALGLSGGAPPASLGLTMSQPLTPRAGSYRDAPELQADVQNQVITETETKLRKGVPPVSGNILYAGFGDRYFLSAYLPEKPATGTLAMVFNDDEAIARMLFNRVSEVRTRVYMGPKLLHALEAVDPALSKAIDFGWAGIIALPFLRTLEVFHRFAPNWGVDIIILTILLRLGLLPMSIRSQRSMMKMQRLQPQMERLREKFKDDQERLQREMVDLYKRNHVNPLGGCAPTAIQFPVFIGLYQALLNAVELRHAPFAGWIRDLSAPDCFEITHMPALPYTNCHGIPVLVLLMGLSTFLQQYMSPTSPDPNQQRMMMLTPIFFTVILINFPAGLSLYYFSSNVLGIIQQFWLNREFRQYSPQQ